MSIEDWNPMEKEYLSSRNDYSVDDEDVGSGLLQEGMFYYKSLVVELFSLQNIIQINA